MLKTDLVPANYPKIVQDFARENFNLKVLTGALLALLLLSLATVAILVKRTPTVIALGENGKVARTESKVTEPQIREAIRSYLSHRYSWTENSIAAELKQAEFFIEPSLVASFRKSMAETVRYVHDKHVTQRVHPNDEAIKVDMKERSVVVLADRITEFDALRAATTLKLTVWFDLGDQTPQNPWGVYIQREQEGGAK